MSLMPTKGLEFYVDPRNIKCYNQSVSTTALHNLAGEDVSSNTLSNADMIQTPSNGYFDFGYNTTSGQYEPYSSSTYSRQLQIPNANIPTAFSSSNDKKGTVAFWLWVSEENVTNRTSDGGAVIGPIQVSVYPAGSPSGSEIGFRFTGGDGYGTPPIVTTGWPKFATETWHFVVVSNDQVLRSSDDVAQPYGDFHFAWEYEAHKFMIVNNETLVPLGGPNSVNPYLNVNVTPVLPNNKIGDNYLLTPHDFRGRIGPIMYWNRRLTKDELDRVYNVHKDFYQPQGT
jgi:hypothetical protein